MFASARWGPVKLLPTLAVCNSHHNILASARHFFRPPSRASNQNDEFVCGEPFRHMTLYEAEAGSPSTGANKPLVLLFQWLYAKPQEVRKYCALYHEIGLDVLAVRGKISHFLWLPEGVKLAAELFCYLERHRPPNEKLLVHASSLGAYNYTITLMATENEASKECQNFRERVVGQIFDSIVIGTYEDMSEGLSEVLSNNETFRRMVLQTVNVYYHITHKVTKSTYNKLVQHFKEEPVPIPTLFFYAENDPVCDTKALEAMIKEWRSKKPGFEVTVVSWPKSIHAAHLKEHREEYVEALQGLLKRLELL